MTTVCSWSGGKDSALALHLASEAGAAPRALLTILDETGERSRSHGLPVAVLEAQAAALGLPLVTRSAGWDGYTAAFGDALAGLAAGGVEECVFGDIDIEEHRGWCERTCAAAGLAARHPLWRRDRRGLLDELLRRGYEATIVVVRAGLLDASLLGRRLDPATIAELEAAGVDACGENGEFHTVVTGGPLFSAPIRLRASGTVAVEDCRVLRIDGVEAGA